MCQTVAALEAIHPYLMGSKIRTAMKKLTEAGLVVKGNDKNPYDRTARRTLAEEGIAWFTGDALPMQAAVPDDGESEETAGRAESAEITNR